jgi:hypothetical protein
MPLADFDYIVVGGIQTPACHRRLGNTADSTNAPAMMIAKMVFKARR